MTRFRDWPPCGPWITGGHCTRHVGRDQVTRPLTCYYTRTSVIEEGDRISARFTNGTFSKAFTGYQPNLWHTIGTPDSKRATRSIKIGRSQSIDFIVVPRVAVEPARSMGTTDFKSDFTVLTSCYCALPSRIYRRSSRQSKLTSGLVLVRNPLIFTSSSTVVF